MKENIVFKTLSCDTIYFGYGETLKDSYPLFQDTGLESTDNFQKLEEKEIVKWLLNNNSFRQLLLNEIKSNSNAIFIREIKKKIFPNNIVKMGEIDIIIVDWLNSYKSISIECKRINEKLNNSGELIFDRNDIQKITKQANRNRSMGFSKTYACLILEVNGKKTNELNPFYSSSSDATLNKMINFPGRNELHEDIGIIIIEAIQTLDKSYHSSNTINLCILKNAVEQEQHAILTENIIKLIPEFSC